MKLGILSTANINRLVIPGAHASPHVELVAVASRTQARADEYAREWEIPVAHGSYEALLADPQIDAVYVSLPNVLHLEWTIRALEAGKHVLCEKPLDARPAEVERAFDAAERAGRILMEAFMYRHHPQTKRIAELVAGGALGELKVVRASFGFFLDDTTNVRLGPELQGGSLLDVGCYCVSLARLVAGEPQLVSGQQVLGPTGVDVRFAGTLRFPADVLAHFDSGFDVAPHDAAEIVGSEATLRIPSPFVIAEPGLELVRVDTVERIEIEQADRYQLELENLAAAIRGEAEPLLGRADALGQARTLDALLRSAADGGAPVAL